jgi:hypothetical protein
MKFVDYASLVRFYTHTDASTFPNEDLLLLSNVHKDEIAKEIGLVNEGYFGMPCFKNLEVGVREYTLPSDLLSSIERVEVKLDGTTWAPLTELDLPLTNIATDETSITNYFTGRKPQYDLFRGSLFLYSDSAIAAVDAGIKLWCILYPTDFDNLTDDRDISLPKNTVSSGFPRQFHELLARRVSIAWKQGQDEPITLNETELKYSQDLQRALVSIRSANFDRAITATEKVDNGFNY